MPIGCKERPSFFDIFKTRCNKAGIDILYELIYYTEKMFSEKCKYVCLLKRSQYLTFLLAV